MVRVLKGFFLFILHKFLKLKFLNLAMLEDQKLYYLRQRSGKSARITEKNKFLQQEKIKDEVKNVDNTETNKTKPVDLKKI